MGLGFLRKLKDFGKKAVKFIQKKALPVANKVWGAAKPLVSMIPKYGTAISGAIDTGFNVVNKVAKSKNVKEAIQNSTSPYIKLKKNIPSGSGSANAPAPASAPAPVVDTGFDDGFDDFAPVPAPLPPAAPQVAIHN